MWFTACNAQGCLPDSGFWGDFSGRLGEGNTTLSFYRLAGNALSGNCRFNGNTLASVSEDNVFLIKGNLKDCNYYLDVINDNHETIGKFIFQYRHDKIKKTDNYVGTYSSADNKQSAVTLQLNSMVGGSLTQRYFELFGTTAEVDSFAARIKAAFIKNDKQWLAAHCRYPLNVFTGSHKPIVIKTEAAFIANYNKYFSQAYRDKFKKMNCYNMFSNHMGAMMGRGEVWMNQTLTSTADNYEYCITAFNVF